MPGFFAAVPATAQVDACLNADQFRERRPAYSDSGECPGTAEPVWQLAFNT